MRAHVGTASLVDDRRDRLEPSARAGRGSDDVGAVRPPARRILIVEDDDLCWRAVDRALRSGGWRCEHATSVAEARALLRGTFDAVLIDLNLGDGGRGEEVLELLAANPTPVATVVLSGCGHEAGANALGLDGIPHIDKPPEFATLRAALDEEVELTRLVIARGLVGLVARAEKGLLRAMLGKLSATGGNQVRAALGLGLARSTLRNRMASYGLRSAAFKPPKTWSRATRLASGRTPPYRTPRKWVTVAVTADTAAVPRHPDFGATPTGGNHEGRFPQDWRARDHARDCERRLWHSSHRSWVRSCGEVHAGRARRARSDGGVPWRSPPRPGGLSARGDRSDSGVQRRS